MTATTGSDASGPANATTPSPTVAMPSFYWRQRYGRQVFVLRSIETVATDELNPLP